MSRNLCVQAVIDELEAANVPYRHEDTKKHYHFWFGDDYRHHHVVASTPSDVRAHKNERASIRRVLEEHGYIQRKQALEVRSEPIIDLKAGHARCYSYHIAEHFGKAHKNVLQAIDKIRTECGSEFDRLNFKPIDYTDDKGRKYRAYSMTRDGFSLVVMGFTGPAATQWKIKYIEAFNEMATELSALSTDREVTRLAGEVEAVTSLLAHMEEQLERLPAQRRATFVRPSIVRQKKRSQRAKRRATA